MTDAELKLHNDEKLTEFYPVFRKKIESILTLMLAIGYRCRIQCAWRSPEAQLEAYTSGHSKLKFGLHNATGKAGVKEALAADIYEDPEATHAPEKYYVALAHFAQQVGLDTGARYSLTGKLRAAWYKATGACDQNYLGKYGWDPSHTEEKVLSLRVKLGWRPKK